jgi:hypothetical protein
MVIVFRAYHYGSVHLNDMAKVFRVCDDPRYAIHLPFPLRRRNQNLQLRILRAMRLIGMITTTARLSYVNAVCALCALSGYSIKGQVRLMMAELLDDYDNCGTNDVQTEKLAAETRRHQELLAAKLYKLLNP